MKIVYGTFDNNDRSAYRYNGKWYPFGKNELFYEDAKFSSTENGWGFEYFEAEERGLNNPPFLVRFEIPE